MVRGIDAATDREFFSRISGTMKRKIFPDHHKTLAAIISSTHSS
jgi:hypothetical protein